MQSRALLGVRRAVRCGAVLCSSVWCGSVQCCAVRFGALRCGSVRCCAVLAGKAGPRDGSLSLASPPWPKTGARNSGYKLHSQTALITVARRLKEIQKGLLQFPLAQAGQDWVLQVCANAFSPTALNYER